MEQWTNERELVISAGPCIVRSVLANGYWNGHQGWVSEKRSATGYPADQKGEWSALERDAELVAYDTAVDMQDDSPGGTENSSQSPPQPRVLTLEEVGGLLDQGAEVVLVGEVREATRAPVSR